MAVQTQRLITEDEYLAIEREALFKSEYLDGEMFADVYYGLEGLGSMGEGK